MTGERPLTRKLEPFLNHCSFCGDGLLRFRRCSSCQRIVALCDECELMWEDVGAVSDDPNLSSDSSFPCCPACGEEQAEWTSVSMEELDENALSQFSSGESE